MASPAGLLRDSIERWAAELRATSPLAQLVKQRQMTPRALAFYLESLRYLFLHSQRNLQPAAERSEALGCTALAEYFHRKVREEVGHDGWAADDLTRLPSEIQEKLRPARSVVALVDLQARLIAQHPMCFVGYAQWTEYFTVLLGDEWLDDLSACGYDRSQVTAVSKHVDADREHAALGFDEIDRMWHGEPDAAVVLAGIEEAERLFESFCEEICAEARRGSAGVTMAG